MVDQKFDAQLRALVLQLRTIGEGVEFGVAAAVGKAAAVVVQRATELTPRSEKAQPHLADGWTFDLDFGGEGRVTARVYNANPRGNDPIRLSTGGETTLLHILEFGSAPHEIRPKKPGGRLVFFWKKIGKMVFAKKVNHPGTRAYSMLGLARLAGEVELKRGLREVRRSIRLRRR